MGSTYSCGVSRSRNALFSDLFHMIFCLLPNVRTKYEAGWEAVSRICFQKQFIGGYCLGYTITLRLVARVSWQQWSLSEKDAHTLAVPV